MIVACATDDGIHFVSRHFGDALRYDLYQLNQGSFEFVEYIMNTTEDEEGHADPKKAKGIIGILKKSNVDLVLAPIFGPNIKRIKEQVLPVIIAESSIQTGLDVLSKNLDRCYEEIKKMDKREPINLT